MSDQVNEIKQLLVQYAYFQETLSKATDEYKERRMKIIPDDIQEALADVDIEFVGMEEQARINLDKIKGLISEKMAALPDKEYVTIKEAGFMVVAKGGKTVNSVDADVLGKGLAMLAVKYPAIAGEISDILAMADVEKVVSRAPYVQAAR